MTNKLFVGGLSFDTNDTTLGDYFAKVGQVLSAKVITDKYTGRSRGFGFVEMSSAEEAEKAIQELNNTSLDGRNVFVKEALPQPERSDNREYRSNQGSGYGGGKRDDRRPKRY